MISNKKHQIVLLAALLVAMASIHVYQRFSEEAPRTQPLTYTRGMSVTAPVRLSLAEGGNKADPLSVLLASRTGSWPGVRRDLFRFSGNGAPVKPAKPKPVVPISVPTVTKPTPTVPVRTAEEIAAENAKLDLSRFRFLGYLTDDKEKGSSLFLSKDSELFIVKSGDTILKSYRVKETGKDHVILMDTVTKVEVKIELQGSTDSPRR